MKRIFSCDNGAELGSLQNVLSAAGIQCVIRENPDPAVPSFLKLELWVGHDAEYPKARGLCTRWPHPSPDRSPFPLDVPHLRRRKRGPL
jgi:hypothetical protein